MTHLFVAGWFDWFWSMLSGLGISPLFCSFRCSISLHFSRAIFNVSFQACGRNLRKSCSSGSTTQARPLYSARCSMQQIQLKFSAIHPFPLILCRLQLQSSQLKQAQPTMHSTHHELKASDFDTFHFPSPFSKQLSPLCSLCPPLRHIQTAQTNADGQLHF